MSNFDRGSRYSIETAVAGLFAVFDHHEHKVVARTKTEKAARKIAKRLNEAWRREIDNPDNPRGDIAKMESAILKLRSRPGGATLQEGVDLAISEMMRIMGTKH